MVKKTLAELKAATAAKKAEAPEAGHALPPPPVTERAADEAPQVDPEAATEASLETDAHAKAPPLMNAAGVSHDELVANEEARVKAGAMPSTAGPAEVRQRDPNFKDATRGGQEQDTRDTTTPAEAVTKTTADLEAELQQLRESNRSLLAENQHLKGVRRGNFEGGPQATATPSTSGRTMRGMIPARTDDIPTTDEINSGVSA